MVDWEAYAAASVEQGADGGDDLAGRGYVVALVGEVAAWLADCAMEETGC